MLLLGSIPVAVAVSGSATCLLCKNPACGVHVGLYRAVKQPLAHCRSRHVLSMPTMEGVAAVR